MTYEKHKEKVGSKGSRTFDESYFRCSEFCMPVIYESAGTAERGRTAPQEISGAGKVCRMAGGQDARQPGISQRRCSPGVFWYRSGAPHFDRDHPFVVYRSVYESVLAVSGDPFGVDASSYLCWRLPCQDADAVRG